MTNYKVEAVVLKSRDIKDVDRIYTIFSKEQGKQRIVGKGVRKITAKLASALEPLTLAEVFLVSSRWLDKAIGAIAVNQFFAVKKQEKLVGEARAVFEILDQIATEKEEYREVYEWLVFYLCQLERLAGEKEERWIFGKLVQLGLIWRIIQSGGFQPGLFNCFRCGQKIFSESDYYVFSVPRGIECGRCASNQNRKKFYISQDVLKAMRILSTQKPLIVCRLRAPENVIRQIVQITKLILEEVLDRRVYLVF